MLLQQVLLEQTTDMLLNSLTNTANADTSQKLQDMAVASWQAHEMSRFAETQLAMMNNACLQMHSVAPLSRCHSHMLLSTALHCS